MDDLDNLQSISDDDLDKHFANFNLEPSNEESREQSENDVSEEETITEQNEISGEEEITENDDELQTDQETDEQDEEDSEKEEETSEEDDGEVSTDEAKELAKLLAPFKANGSEMSVDNVDEAIVLMKKGANYEKKMSALKPQLRIISTLENNGLLDQNKLDQLIAISKHDPKAIAKLLGESKLDPLSLDVDEAADYKPETYALDASTERMKEVMDEMESTPEGREVLQIVANEWDEESKAVFISNPQGFEILRQHKELGIYDKVTALVQKQRALGNLKGLTDFQAYKQVGDAMFQQQQQADVTETVNKQPTKVKDPNLARKRKAAANTGRKSSKTKLPAVNPLSLSDDELDEWERKYLK